MRYFNIGICLIIAIWPMAAIAKPLLTSTEDTFASVCIGEVETGKRLIEICERALETSGASDAQILEMKTALAWAYHLDGDSDAARVMYRQVLESNPALYDALSGLAWLAFAEDAHTEAADYFAQAFEASPTAEAWGGLGISLFYADRIETPKVLEYLDAALAIDPEYSWVLRRKGWIYGRDNQYTKAEEMFRAALKIWANDEYAHYGLADALNDQRRHKEALPHASRALELDPDIRKARALRALILYRLDRPKQSIKDADILIETSPDWSTGYVRKARALSKMGQRGDALDLLAKADARLGFDDFLVYWYAHTLTDEARYQDALDQIERSTVLDESDVYDHRLRAFILLEMDDLASTRSAVDVALNKFPNDERIVYYDALTMVAEGRFEAAETRFDIAIEQGLRHSFLSRFLSTLVAKSRYLQAIKMRVRYKDIQE